MPPVTKSQSLYHDISMPVFLRLALLTFGAFVTVMTPLELWQGLWPLNLLSPFFGLIIGGAWFVGFFLIYSALFGRRIEWHIRPDHLVIKTSTPFSGKDFSYCSRDISNISVIDHDWSDGPTTWEVVITTKDDRSHTSRPFSRQEDADQFKSDIENLIFKK